ncbi:MAG TPA: rhomboid family intramembrane serine protease [Gemmataceae bacterium]|nr:rhomboid family intramembrane serine protease [Gemmataceae bacterium]
MRQLTTLPNAADAHALADYLLTLKIDTQLEKQPEGWAIWIRDEDHVPRARQELEEYQRNPADPRYKGAGNTAALLRKQKLQEEKAYHRRQERFYARMGRAGAAGGVTLTLIAISVIVFILKDGFTFGPSLTQTLFIAPYEIKLVSYNPFAESAEEALRWELRSPGLKPILHGEIWRLVTPIFIHFGIWHIVFNIWCLYVLGGAIERRRGRGRYLALVLATAILSNLAQYFLGHIGSGAPLASLPRQPGFGGMSGVVYGLFGYIWMKTRFQPELGLLIDRTNIIIMMGWFFLCMTPLIHTIVPQGVANVAHAAGLLAGMLIGYVPTLWKTEG